MSRVATICAICHEPGYLYDIIDNVPRPYGSPERMRQCGLCELCRDLIGSGWAEVQPVGVSLV